MHTLAEPARFEQTIKRSRFVAEAAFCADEQQATEFISRISRVDARHHCWAWRVAPQYRFNDAGEPGGTAGRPIYQSIENQHLDQVVVVVSRWFGGIKLGTGGLARAYGGTSAECLRTAARRPLVVMSQLVLWVPFDALADTHRLAESHSAEKLNEAYTESGLQLSIRLPRARQGEFLSALSDATRGSARVLTPS